MANGLDASDRDVAVMRLLEDGSPDLTFDPSGVRVLDLNTAIDNGTALVALDAARGLSVDAIGRIYVHAVQRGAGTASDGGPRTDTDFAVVRLTADGDVDGTYGGGDGRHLLDIQESNATPRGLMVLSDGSAIAGGYATSPDLGTSQPVLYKLDPSGELDTAFASGGVFHQQVLPILTEVYQFALHGNSIVTGGYGRSTGSTNDWVSMRFDITTGARDRSWGGAPDGAVLLDPSGSALGINCRGAIGLPSGETILIGSTGPGNQPTQDAVFAVLDAGGVLDTDYGDGIHTYRLGANGNDQFWGGAVSGNNVLIVGYQGGGTTQTDTVNDDAFAVVVPIR